MKPADFSISLNNVEVVGFDLNLNLACVRQLFPNGLITKKIYCASRLCNKPHDKGYRPHFMDSDTGVGKGRETRWVSEGKLDSQI